MPEGCRVLSNAMAREIQIGCSHSALLPGGNRTVCGTGFAHAWKSNSNPSPSQKRDAHTHPFSPPRHREVQGEGSTEYMWWPGLSTELGELVKSCQECCKAQRQRPQPLTPSSLPELPWQRVGTDLFEWKQKHFLIIVDYYSRFVEIARLQRTTAEDCQLSLQETKYGYQTKKWKAVWWTK